MACLTSPFLAAPATSVKVAPRKSLTSSVTSATAVPIRCSARQAETWGDCRTEAPSPMAAAAVAICGAIATFTLAAGDASAASAPRLPPLDKDPNRCERAYDGNTIGQANGVADKVLDLRGCDFKNDTKLRGKTLSAALMADANFDGADLTETVMSKAYAAGASFRGADFTNAVLDRVFFDGADLTNANFSNAVLSGSTFEGSNLTDTVFDDALIGYVDIQKICRNTTLSVDAKAFLGCK